MRDRAHAAPRARRLDGADPLGPATTWAELLATDRRGPEGLLYGDVAQRRGEKGKHVLRAIVTDVRGRKAEAQRVVRVCR